MALSQSVLGMNARNYLYIRKFNRRAHKLIADDKLQTKKLLVSNNVPTPGLIASFMSFRDARSFAWNTLPRSFVIKPAHGYAGQGITLVAKWDADHGRANKKNVNVGTLESEIFGILDGAHSLNNLPDYAFIEERVTTHFFFKKLTAGGVPDIRIIVCNGIPVMAMLRLPTKYSDGKANLSLGAVGIGIDMRTGITTHAISRGDITRMIPGTKIKVHGLKLPQWENTLRVAVEAQQVSKLGFVGIDIVLDEEKGPLVLEINARPGLSIQVANQASLRTRLERVSNLPVPTTDRAIQLAQQLFADSSLEAVDVADRTLGVIEKITIQGSKKKKTVRAKIDTGAFRTSIDVDLVHELGLDEHDKLVHVRSGSGKQKRKTANITFKMKGKQIKTIASYTERNHLRFPVIIGRRDLKGFLVDPEKIPEGIKVK